jgi:NAD(P)-dependent dehydrogenase (short-subunit alcohol dehydrogenase family)
MSTSLQGRLVIVTGAGGNIGNALCRGLAREGANLVLADQMRLPELVRDIEALGREALSVVVDVADAASTQAMAQSAFERFGRIDGLINNAGFFKGCTFGSFIEIPVDEWDLCFAVNVRGVWLCCKAVMPFMREQGGGKIVNISSNTPYKGVPNFLHYVSSKAAVLGLSRALAREVGQYGICVNSLCPDLIPDAEIIAKQGSMANERTVAQRCIQRTQVPDDMVGAAAFLVGPGSDFVTGQSLLVNGGAYFN